MQLRIEGFAVSVSLGVYPREKQHKRKILIDILVDFAPRLRADRLSETLDYDALALRVRKVAAARHYELIETMLNEVGAAILKFPTVKTVRVEIAKPGALKGAKSVSITHEFSRGARK